jgi:hypothetical protein
MKLKDMLKETSIEVPYHVWTTFGPGSKKIVVMGDQASLVEEGDYVDKEKIRKALEWYVDQMGGKVKWEK